VSDALPLQLIRESPQDLHENGAVEPLGGQVRPVLVDGDQRVRPGDVLHAHPSGPGVLDDLGATFGQLGHDARLHSWKARQPSAMRAITLGSVAVMTIRAEQAHSDA
jgi:hypothetical protein